MTDQPGGLREPGGGGAQRNSIVYTKSPRTERNRIRDIGPAVETFLARGLLAPWITHMFAGTTIAVILDVIVL